MKCPNCNSDKLTIHSQSPQRWACGGCNQTTRSPVTSYDYPTQVLKSEKLVVTWAQNNTPVHARFLDSLLAYCKKNKAQLIVMAGRYRNPTSKWEKNDETEWYDERIEPYLCNDELQLNSNLLVMPASIQPTATNPLSGMKTMSGALSCIFGHPQVAFESVATPQSKLAKIVCTTGSVTKPNYSDSKAGRKGEFHHDFAATLIELESDNKTFHMRQLVASPRGLFYDLDSCYDGDKVTQGHRPLAFVPGDLHCKFLDERVKSAFWTAKDSLCKTLKPKAQVLHDVLDAYAVSHHHQKNPFLKFKKHVTGDDCALTEVTHTMSTLDELLLCDKNFIVSSNHHDHIDQYLCERDWRTDPQNAKFYLQTSLAWITALEAGESFNTLKYWAEQTGTAKKLTFLKRSDVKVIGGHVVSYHGDSGVNGARGSAKGFSGIGTKSVIGHSHSPKREKGCIQVGLSAIYGLEYATGSPSSWVQTGALIYPNGKATLISVINGKWRL